MNFIRKIEKNWNWFFKFVILKKYHIFDNLLCLDIIARRVQTCKSLWFKLSLMQYAIFIWYYFLFNFLKYNFIILTLILSFTSWPLRKEPALVSFYETRKQMGWSKKQTFLQNIEKKTINLTTTIFKVFYILLIY